MQCEFRVAISTEKFETSAYEPGGSLSFPYVSLRLFSDFCFVVCSFRLPDASVHSTSASSKQLPFETTKAAVTDGTIASDVDPNGESRRLLLEV